MIRPIGCCATRLVVIDGVSGTGTTFLIPGVLVHSDVVGVPALRQTDYVSSDPDATALGVLSQDDPTLDVCGAFNVRVPLEHAASKVKPTATLRGILARPWHHNPLLLLELRVSNDKGTFRQGFYCRGDFGVIAQLVFIVLAFILDEI